jgi:hypothetical protein
MTDQPQQHKISRSSAIDGYLSLLLIVIFSFIPKYWQPPAQLEMPFWVTAWALILLFAISGVRRGQRGACVAAWISLSIMILVVLKLLLDLLLYH